MNALTDIELEQRAGDGDREAFGVLYERYSQRVHDFLLRMVREPAEAADLTQETFVRAMRSMKSERAGKAEFSTWLFTIARNLALTRLERSKRTQPLADEDESEDASVYYRFDPDRLDDPETAAQAYEMASLVWQASEALDPKQRTLLDLHVRQGLDSAEIATVLGVSKGNAYTMVSRLKDTFESAVAGLIMFRAGRRHCPDLNQLLEDHGATKVSPEVRKLIERHTKDCDTCQGRRRELVSASALLRAFVPMPMLPSVASRLRDGAWEQVQLAGPAGGASAPAGTAHVAQGSGHGGGLLSAPVRALQALPGPAWLAPLAAVVVVGIAVPAVVLSARSGGGASGGRMGTAAQVVAPTATAGSAVPVAPTAAAGGEDAVSAGGAHTCVVIDGGVWCWGANGNGQLGNNSTTDSPVPVAVSGMESGVTAISAGNATTCAVKDTGAWCWGASGNGQLGNNSAADSPVPVAVAGMANGATAISAGGTHTCAVRDGAAWCWGGGNFFGALGDSTAVDSLVPVAVSGLSGGVSAVDVGGNATCAVRDGGAFCWGDNFNGKLGLIGGEDCGGDPCSRVPLPVAGMASGVSSITTDGNYTCVLKDSTGSCRGMGHGIPRTGLDMPEVTARLASGVTAISVGGNHACALKADSVWCWGTNNQGQLGNSSTADSIAVPVAVVGLPGGPAVPVATAASTPAQEREAAESDRLRAAIRAHSPGIEFDPECSANTPQGPCATGSWPAEMLASGIAGVSVHTADGGTGTWYGRKADGTWVFWFATQNSGGPLTILPGDMIVCADGDGLNLRAEPSTSAAVVTLIPDGTIVRGDRFVMTDPSPSPGGFAHGWYHLTSPQEGWAYDRYLLGHANGVESCIKSWWPGA